MYLIFRISNKSSYCKDLEYSQCYRREQASPEMTTLTFLVISLWAMSDTSTSFIDDISSQNHF